MAVLRLAEEVHGHLKASEYTNERIEDIRSILNEGDQIEAKVISVDRKNRLIHLSVKDKTAHENAETMRQMRQDTKTAASTNFG